MSNDTISETVMLVDDTPANLRFLQAILRNAGYRVVAFPHGKGALKAAVKNPPDIILLDILMPEMDGFEVCKRLKADEVLKNIPILFISALSEQKDKLRAFEAGGVDYVTKPFQEQEVLVRVKTHLQLSRLTRQLESMVSKRTVQLEKANEALRQEIVFRREAELKLQRSQTMLQMVFEGISEPLLLVDPNMRVKLMNKTASSYYRALGIVLEPGKKLCTKTVSENPGFCIGCSIPELVSKGEYCRFERQGLADSERTEKVFIYPADKEENVSADAIIRIMDITDDIRLKQEIAQADKMIALGTLVAGVAHEINNPNHVILLNVPILSDVWQKVSPIFDEYCQTHEDFFVGAMPFSQLRKEIPRLILDIESSADRIKKIVAVLKDYSAKDDKTTILPLEINQAIENVIMLLNHKIKKCARVLKVGYGKGIPAVKGDRHKLEQVFVNLISNALEAIPNRNGGVFVRTFFDPTKKRAVIEVRDEGIGIPEKSISKITTPFYTTKRSSGGTGLGLAIAHQIIQHHGGAMEVKSIEGRGSTFKVTLPVAPGPEVAVA